ncbi:hypothetical protein [Microbulbifer sp.]|uniref:hypothetical protein n=1 Tax=Microbulbifer sp. TaxID=1908541 RepID=UPI0025899E21|nr:hypothetical protein [Microbulbifer sp.]
MENLPRRILKMVEILHRDGYKNIYIYSGMSPSGIHWRFSIGRMKSGCWPQNDYLVFSSIKDEGVVEWSEDNSSAEVLAKNFVSYYGLNSDDKVAFNANYHIWYSELLKILKNNELLVFYADYDDPHSYLLKYAPGFCGKSS